MALPKNISRHHVLQAIKQIDEKGVPNNRHSTKYLLKHNEKAYPPKYTLSIANTYANGKELPPSFFSGGAETNTLLAGLGFKIEPSSTSNDEDFIDNQNEFNAKLLEESILKQEYVKGKETKYYLLTAKVPKASESVVYYQIYVRENHQTVKKGEVSNRGKTYVLTKAKKEAMKLLLKYNPTVSVDDITMMHYKQDRPNSDAWQKESYEIVNALYNECAELNALIDIETVKKDLEAEQAEEEAFHHQEGAVSYYYGKRYERNPTNRKRAIEIHGLTCVACGFNFEKVYGEHGKDFIEVHHIRPLSTLKEEVEVNPAEDLVPVCSNCHRMIHRQRDNVLSIEELRKLLGSLT